MNIVFLDADSIGTDIDLSGFDKIGTVTRYGYSTKEEMAERVKDADVLVVKPFEYVTFAILAALY